MKHTMMAAALQPYANFTPASSKQNLLHQPHACSRLSPEKMPITFGSVGDIISLSLLIKDLVKSLDSSRGSSAEYQAVIRELWSLDHALLEVEALTRSCEQTAQLNALTATVNQCANQCRKCVTRFHEQVKKFGKNLQPGGSGSFIRDTASKIKWQVSEKDDLAKFRAEINAHCFSINMLLTTTGMFVFWNYDPMYGFVLTSIALLPN